MSLIDELVQLGEEKPHLQNHLKAILDDLLGKKEEEDTSNWYETNDKPEDPPVSTPAKPGHGLDPVADPEDEGFFVSPKARQAFESVLLPEIKSRLDSRSFDKIYQMMSEIESLGTSQNNELENSLIVFKPVSMNTNRFYTEVQEAFRDWILPRLDNQDAKEVPGGAENGKQYNFNFQ